MARDLGKSDSLSKACGITTLACWILLWNPGNPLCGSHFVEATQAGSHLCDLTILVANVPRQPGAAPASGRSGPTVVPVQQPLQQGHSVATEIAGLGRRAMSRSHEELAEVLAFGALGQQLHAMRRVHESQRQNGARGLVAVEVGIAEGHGMGCSDRCMQDGKINRCGCRDIVGPVGCGAHVANLVPTAPNRRMRVDVPLTCYVCSTQNS